MRGNNTYENRIGISYSLLKRKTKGVIKVRPEDFIVKEIWKGVILDFDREVWLGSGGDFLLVLIEKKDWDTLKIVREISKRLGISRKRIKFAGTKDKRSLSIQILSIFGVDEDEISKLKIRDVRLKVIGRQNKPIGLGDLDGNYFEITIRNVEREDIAIIKDNIEKINQEGVPSFYYFQRFGNRLNNHLVGKELVRRNFENAAKIFLTDYLLEKDEESREARVFLSENWGEFKKALKIFPKKLTYERIILEHLAKYPRDFVNAMRRLPKELLKILIHAYQAYLFNIAVSIRGDHIKDVLKGDIVFECRGWFVDRENPKFAEHISYTENFVATAFLPGYKAKIAKGFQGDLEKDLLKKEDIRLEDFYIKQFPEISSEGGRREVLIRTKIDVRDISKDGLNPGKFKVKIAFCLMKGCYATSVLRELLVTSFYEIF